jgi:hypothetical protein
VSDQLCADERRFNAFAKNSVGSTWPVEGLVEVAADGEVVWSCNPVLFSFAKERIKHLKIKAFGDMR